MHRRNRPGWRHRALAAGLAITLLAATTACRSAAEQATVEPAVPQISVPLDDGGFENLATSRQLTPEEWARLMGYPDISDRLPTAEDDGLSVPTQEEPEEPLTGQAATDDPSVTDGIEAEREDVPEDGSGLLSYQPEEEAMEDDGVEGSRILDDTEDGAALVPTDDVEADLGDGDAFLAGELQRLPDDQRQETPSTGDGEVRIVEEPHEAEDDQQMDPEVIQEIAEASAVMPGEANAMTFIIEHFAYVFLAAFAFLAILIFIAMSRFSSSGGDEPPSIRRRRRSRRSADAATADRDEKRDLGPLPTGKSFVYQADEETLADGKAGGPSTQTDVPSGTGDELELEPLDGLQDIELPDPAMP